MEIVANRHCKTVRALAQTQSPPSKEAHADVNIGRTSASAKISVKDNWIYDPGMWASLEGGLCVRASGATKTQDWALSVSSSPTTTSLRYLRRGVALDSTPEYIDMSCCINITCILARHNCYFSCVRWSADSFSNS